MLPPPYPSERAEEGERQTLAREEKNERDKVFETAVKDAHGAVRTV